MPPSTRSQTAREAIATIDAPPDVAITEKQESNSVRLRQATSGQFAMAEFEKSQSTRSGQTNTPDEPPRFTIDLSLPPEQRYLEVCTAFKSEMLNLTSLFDEVVGGMIHFISVKWLRFLCRLLLRKVYNNEENAELKGISKASGVDVYLLVCFNVLLDLFMGCSSGGATVRAGTDVGSGSKTVHFRTLDWGMPALRRIVVQLDYVLEKDGPVIASSITYAGFVGVLTGVRTDLSLSLNFRPNRIDNGKFWSDAKYIWHHVMVLLGMRPSISCILRSFLLPQREENWLSWLPFVNKSEMITLDYSEIVKKIGGETERSRPMTTTACYLCFCNGKRTTVIEKDRISAKVHSGTEFTIVTNSDDHSTTVLDEERTDHKSFAGALAEIVGEAKDRQECAQHNWNNMRVEKSKRTGLHILSEDDILSLMEVDDVIEMVQKYPTTNECTHFACVMDPAEGTVRWCRRWMEPVTAKWIREHMSDTW